MQSPPVIGENKSSPSSSPLADKKRYHDLDALRGFAMLLGIVIHALQSFIPIPIPVAPQDINQSPEIYGYVFNVIHGFRMPLFFLISGFFTAMLWRNLGLRDLLKHRAKRILLPLVIMTPLMWLVIIIFVFPVGKWKAESRKISEETNVQIQEKYVESTIWSAAQNGDTEAINRYLEQGADINATGGKMMSYPPLIRAAMNGHARAAQLLIEKGADVNAKAFDGMTALTFAVFFGQTETVKLLIDNDADVNMKGLFGLNPIDYAKAEGVLGRFHVKAVNIFLRVKKDWKEIKEARPKIDKLLKKAGGRSEGMSTVGLLGIGLMLGVVIPVTGHLWFLCYLVWLVLGFAVIVRINRRLKWKPCPSWMIRSPWLWLVLLTLLPQICQGALSLMFSTPMIGPDVSMGVLPSPPILLYYAVFFGFGAICYGREEFEQQVKRPWPIYFVLAIPALLLGMYWVDLRNEAFATGWEANQSQIIWYHCLGSLCQVFFAWLMIFGCIGLFRHFFSGENKKIRYMSDASYWLYVTHVFPITMLQIWVSDWHYPSFLKFLFICVLTVGILLLIYEFMIRYTWVGTMLNGKRTREPVDA